MTKAPRDPNESILAGGTIQAVLFRGTIIGIVVIIAQFIRKAKYLHMLELQWHFLLSHYVEYYKHYQQDQRVYIKGNRIVFK